MPITNATAVAMNPTIRETRPPYIILVSISRPNMSVPNQCWIDGLVAPNSKFCASYPYGAIKGVSREVIIRMHKIANPKRARRFLLSFIQASFQSELEFSSIDEFIT
jgi:hypothetical protein